VATVPPFDNFVKAVGGTPVYTGKALAAATSYAAQCLASKQAGANGVYLAMTTDVGIRVVDDCAQQGYKPQYFVGGGYIPISAWGDKNVQGHLEAGTGPFPWASPTNAAVETFTTAAKQYAPQYVAEKSPGVSSGWYVGLMIQQALASITASTDVTPATMLSGLEAFKDENIQGTAMAVLTFNKSGPQPMTPCMYVVGVGNLPVHGIGGALCMPASLVKVGGIPAPGGVAPANTSTS
jgi:branched-chain amino acid transport system substrate-binding protein